MTSAPLSLPDDLDAIREEAFALLARGARDRRSAFHTPIMATIGLDGRPRARVVVLRACEGETLTLRIHTDARSAKVAELRRDPRAALTFYDSARKWQVRVDGVTRLHQGDTLAQSAWDGSQAMSRRCYAAEPGPGTRLRAGGDFVLPADDEAAEAGQARFVVLMLKLEQLEWLHLAAAGHRRALFAFGDEPRADWLAP